MKKLIIAAGAIALLSGCAPQTNFYYPQPGKTAEDLSRDDADCAMRAASSPAAATGTWMGVGLMTSIRQNCMRSHGWVQG